MFFANHGRSIEIIVVRKLLLFTRFPSQTSLMDDKFQGGEAREQTKLHDCCMECYFHRSLKRDVLSNWHGKCVIAVSHPCHRFIVSSYGENVSLLSLTVSSFHHGSFVCGGSFGL